MNQVLMAGMLGALIIVTTTCLIFWSRSIKAVKVFLIFMGIFSSINIYSKTICVDIHAKNSPNHADGSCWEKPFKDLQTALDRAVTDKSINQIWVAAGTYHPTKTYTPLNQRGEPIVGGAISLPAYNPGITETGILKNYKDFKNEFDSKLKTFNLVNGVSIYGGFKGIEKDLTDRSANPTLHETILDGNNGWHVVTAGNDITLAGVTAKLDRLTIKGGNALNAPYSPINFPLDTVQAPIYYHDDGGGLYIFMHSNIELNNITFTHNTAVSGGGIFIHDGSRLIITNSHFNNNSALQGGAITIRGGGPHDKIDWPSRTSTLKITNTTFTQNIGLISGAAIYVADNYSSPPLLIPSVIASIIHSKFTYHQSLGMGDSLIEVSAGKVELRNNEIKNNALGLFSALVFCYDANLFLINNKFLNNSLLTGSLDLFNNCGSANYP